MFRSLLSRMSEADSEADTAGLRGAAPAAVDDAPIAAPAPVAAVDGACAPVQTPAPAAAAPRAAAARPRPGALIRQPSFDYYDPAMLGGQGPNTVQPLARRRPATAGAPPPPGASLLGAFAHAVGQPPPPAGGQEAAAAAAAAAADEIDYVLRPQSFVLSDLLSDEQVHKAILALLNDHRKRVWSQVRTLEAKFRDDLGIELARRWQHWMAMAPELVQATAERFIFRKRELGRAMGFQRSALNVGFVGEAHARLMEEETQRERAAAAARRRLRPRSRSGAGGGGRRARARLDSLDITTGRERAETAGDYDDTITHDLPADGGGDVAGEQPPGGAAAGSGPWGHSGAQQRDAVATLTALFSRSAGPLGAAPSGLQAVPFFFSSVLGPALATLPAAASQLGRGAVQSLSTTLDPETVKRRLAALGRDFTGINFAAAAQGGGASEPRDGGGAGASSAAPSSSAQQQQHAATMASLLAAAPAPSDDAGAATADYQRRLVEAYLSALGAEQLAELHTTSTPAAAAATTGAAGGAAAPHVHVAAAAAAPPPPTPPPKLALPQLRSQRSLLSVRSDELDAASEAAAAEAAGKRSGVLRSTPRTPVRGGAAAAGAGASAKAGTSVGVGAGAGAAGARGAAGAAGAAAAPSTTTTTWVQTAFGLSHLPSGLQAVASSFAAGTASVQGQGAAAPLEVPLDSYGVSLTELAAEAGMLDTVSMGLGGEPAGAGAGAGTGAGGGDGSGGGINGGSGGRPR
jgi:hypothetical protein